MTKASSPSPQPASQEGPRSTRRQRRGAERVQLLLAAAEELLAERGYQAFSLKAIGERAGVPTASVYHYFSDRGQVEAELLRGHMDDLSHAVADALDSTHLSTVRAVVDTLLDTVVTYYRAHPSFMELWLVGRNSTLQELMETFDSSQAERLWQLLTERNLIRPLTPLLVVELAFEAGDRLLEVAFRGSPTGDDSVVLEAQRLVSAYLELYEPRTN